jgi:hypothetical protein
MPLDFGLSFMEKQLTGADRRLPSNHCLSVLIDVGLTYQKTHGSTVARDFYVSRGIPEEVAARVLSRSNGRRNKA